MTLPDAALVGLAIGGALLLLGAVRQSAAAATAGFAVMIWTLFAFALLQGRW